MFFISIILLFNSISSIKSSALITLNLTLSPNEKYYEIGDTVDVYCDINNPNNMYDVPQLWHIDFKTGKRTPITRSLIMNPSDDAPGVFKNNKYKRIQYLRKNFLRISNLQLEDSARYECNCPDCDEYLEPKTHKLQVMKLVEPNWYIEPGWPIQERTKVTIRCVADDFYPFVDYKIIKNHHIINTLGHVDIPKDDVYPHRFTWETTMELHGESHNTTLVCKIKQGNYERHATKILEILFTPRFLHCAGTQLIDSSKDKSSISCSFAGNPTPQLVWYRQIDNQSITNDSNYIITTESENHDKYKSILTFNRRKSSYDGDFVAKLILWNNEKDSKKISIVDIANQTKVKVNHSGNVSRKTLSTSIFLFAFIVLKFR